MSDISEIVKKLDEDKAFLAIDPDSYPRNTRAGMESRRRAAQERMVVTSKELQDHLQEHGEAYGVVGDGKAFVADAQKRGPVVVVDAAAPYRQIADRVEPTLPRSSREWTATQYSVMMSEILTRYADLELERPHMATPSRLSAFHVGEGEELVGKVRELVREVAGDHLAGNAMVRALMKGVLERNLHEGLPALVITGLSSREEAAALGHFWPITQTVVPKKTATSKTTK